MSGAYETKNKSITRDTLWGTHDGRRVAFKDMEDTHLLNMLGFLGRRIEKIKNDIKDFPEMDPDTLSFLCCKLTLNEDMLKVVDGEVDSRKLDRSLVADGKSLPFKKGDDWYIWKKGDSKPTKIPNSIDFIKPLNGN